jgi:hypothetical protein
MPQWDGTLPVSINLDVVAERLRTTLSTTSVATALFPLLPSPVTVSGRLTARPSAPEPPLPVQVPTPVPLSTTRVIPFEDADDA